MKSLKLVLAAAVALAMTATAHAQYRDNPYGGGRPSYGGGYPPNGGYERGRGGSPAYQIGVEDGRHDGEHDMVRRHSFRPEQNGKFRHADRGYRGFYGDKQFYKGQYRAGYLEGYRMGYRGGYRDYRR